MNWGKVTAIFGGTFDPPHRGHLEAVRGLFRHPGVKRVVVIPAASPPHKPSIASAEERLEMTRLCFLSDPELSSKLSTEGELRIDNRELERARLAPGTPSYSFDTLRELKQTEPELAFVIGTDQLVRLHTWHRFRELLALCHWIVLERKPETASSPATGGLSTSTDVAGETLREWQASGLARPAGRSGLWLLSGQGGPSSTFLLQTPTDAPALSSTQIRESIAKTGLPPAEALPSDALNYLKRRRIYGMSQNHDTRKDD